MIVKQRYYDKNQMSEGKFAELFTTRLQSILDERKMSHYQLSLKANISQSSISTLFTRGTLPSFYSIARICQGLDMTIAEFFSKGFGEATCTSDQYDEIHSMLETMTDEQKQVLIAYMKGLMGKDFQKSKQVVDAATNAGGLIYNQASSVLFFMD